MAYNRHFIHKRKSLKVHQINSSARVSPLIEDDQSPVKIGGQKALSRAIIDEARNSGVLTLADWGLTEVPQEVYHINRPDKRRSGYAGFHGDSIPQEEAAAEAGECCWWQDVLLERLDLSGNRLARLSPDIRYLAHLSALDLEDNRLERVPPELAECARLVSLNVRRNRLTVVPECIGALAALQHVYLGGNRLRALPTEFCRLQALTALDLSNNCFSCIPEFIGNFIRLKWLSLAGNKIKALPSTFSKLKALTFLDLSQNILVEFPKALDAPFEILKVNVNSISEFPIYRSTPTLRELYLDNNQVTSISSLHLSYIPHVNVLTMSKNQVMELPGEIVDLHALTHLDVSFNNLQSIPYALGNMNSLQILFVDGNPFRSINRTAITSGTEILKRYLRTRNNTNGVEHGTNTAVETSEEEEFNILHIDAHELNSTGTLDLSNHKLQTIPENYFEVLKYKKIRAVLLAHNKLTEFPIGMISCASTIVKLDFSFNLLLDIPNIFNYFVCLKHLNLNGNYIRLLPESFSDMKNSLITLEIAHNPVGLELPDVIFQLVNLQFLNASSCAIVHINPDNFMKLKNLFELDLSNNEIEIIPPEFGLCQHIKNVNFDGNKIRNPALTSLSQGTEAVFEYLRSQIPQKSF